MDWLFSSDELIFCAGLPMVGARSLTATEQSLLKQESRMHFGRALALSLIAPVSVIFPITVSASIDSSAAQPEFLDDVFATFLILSIFLIAPFSLYFASKAFERYRLIRRTLDAGVVRVFEGTSNNEDPTDTVRRLLLKKGLFSQTEAGGERIELYAADDVIYKVNGRRSRHWVEITLTMAALPPQSPAIFGAPIDWQLPKNDGRLVRRRITSGEKDEILSYARKIRRGTWLQILFGLWLMASLIKAIANSFGLQPVTSVQIGIVLASIGSGVWFFRQGSVAEQYVDDAEGGWVVVLGAQQAQTLSEEEANFTANVEILPHSGALWIVAGKPAAWRRQKVSN